jgi:hypothetical protein
VNLVLHHRTTPASTTCVVCRDSDGVVAVCRGCGTTTHAECVVESRGCPTIGCARRDVLPVAPWTGQPPASTTCVVCRDSDGVVAVCRGCGTTTHAECAVESRGCPTIGCARRDVLPVAPWTGQHIDLRPLPSARRPSRTVQVPTRSRVDRAMTELRAVAWTLLGFVALASMVVLPILYSTWVTS